MRSAWLFQQCWDVHVASILVSILLFYTIIEHSVMVSARGCPGSTCISPVWLERCKLSLSLSLSLLLPCLLFASVGQASARTIASLPWTLFTSLLTHRLVLLCIDANCFIFWDLPGDVLAAPESALGLDRCNTSLSLSLSLHLNQPWGWIGVILLSLSLSLSLSSACGPCLLALVLLRVPAWTVSLCILWTFYMCSPSGLCATLAAMANARDVISICLSSDARVVR